MRLHEFAHNKKKKKENTFSLPILCINNTTFFLTHKSVTLLFITYLVVVALILHLRPYTNSNNHTLLCYFFFNKNFPMILIELPTK